MRKVIFLLIIILSVPGVLWAADPIIGTWKLKSTNIENLKEAVNIYREIEGDMIELTDKNILKDGTTQESKWIWPKEGGVAKCISREMPEIMEYVEILVEPGHWYVSIMVNGRKVAMYHKKVSKDGKTLTQTLVGTNAEGESGDEMRVYERQ